MTGLVAGPDRPSLIDLVRTGFALFLAIAILGRTLRGPRRDLVYSPPRSPGRPGSGSKPSSGRSGFRFPGFTDDGTGQPTGVR
jgi:hypothetical protein